MTDFTTGAEQANSPILILPADLFPEFYQENIDPQVAYWQRLALTDELTGLPNRRAINMIVDRLIEREPGGFAVLAADLDDLKLANTQGGHAGGDKYIMTAADQLTLDKAKGIVHDTLRTRDAEQHDDRVHDIEGSDAARVGGDEFLVVTRGIRTQRQLTVVTNRLITNLEKGGVKASTGSALHRPGMSREELFDEADRASEIDKAERRAKRQARERKTLSLAERAGHEAVEAVRLQHGVDLDRHYRLYGTSSRPQSS